MSIRGKRVRYIIILKKTTGKDDYNQPVEAWNPAAALDGVADASGGVYAEQHFKGGDEGEKDGQILAWQKVIWKIPTMESLNAKDYKIKYENEIYDIENIWLIRRANMMVKTTQKDNR